MKLPARFMIDLETVGTERDSPVFAIGIAFHSAKDPDTIISSKCLAKPDMSHADPDTMKWGEGQPEWTKQLEEAQATGEDTLRRAMLLALRRIKQQDPEGFKRAVSTNDTEYWANAPTFDLAMLSHQIGKDSNVILWKFWQERCFRTARALMSAVWPKRMPVAHDCEKDAVQQMKALRHAEELLNESMR